MDPLRGADGVRLPAAGAMLVEWYPPIGGMVRMKMTIPVNARGNLTIPAKVRSRLGMEGAGQFELELAEDAIVLRPMAAHADEDAWAYTPDHRVLLERAHRDSREGRVHRLTEAGLERLAEEADRTDSHAAVREHVTPR